MDRVTHDTAPAQCGVKDQESETIFDQKEYVMSMNPSSNWNFEGYSGNSNTENNDGVYFYGAPGTAVFDDIEEENHDNEESIWNIKGREGHSDLVQYSANSMNRYRNNIISEFQNKIPICTFYKAGDCRFGLKCRNYHEEPCYDQYDEDGANAELENCIYETKKEAADSYIECSICISVPEKEKGQLYGIMSHCNCVFCLGCIREWRVEGVKIASKAEQVRMCPTCRVKSFFVIPSINYVSGQDKDALIGRYRQSLSAKPCKVSFDNPFVVALICSCPLLRLF